MKTWIRLYDKKNTLYSKDFTLNGKWSEKSVVKFLAKRPWLGEGYTIKITYL